MRQSPNAITATVSTSNTSITPDTAKGVPAIGSTRPTGTTTASSSTATLQIAQNTVCEDFRRFKTIPDPALIGSGLTTAAALLLKWPQIKELLAVQYEPSYVLKLELSKKPSKEDLLPMYGVECKPNLDRGVMDNLVECYFQDQHFASPVLDYHVFESVYLAVHSRGTWQDLDAGLVLLVCALGAAVFPNHNRAPGAPYRAGIDYFKAALAVMGVTSCFANVADYTTAQCFALAGAYLGYLGRPLESHRFITIASSVIVNLLQLSSFDTRLNPYEDVQRRIYWTCYMFESQLLNETVAPRTSLEFLVDTVELPLLRGPQDLEMVCFCAGVAVRRLQNSIRRELYAPDKSLPINAMLPIASELLYQLESWLQSIPKDVRPDLNDMQHCERKKLSLRLRYIICKSFIHRPFLLHVLSSDPQTKHSDVLLNHSRSCIEACQRFLLLYQAHIEKPRSILWNIAQVIFGASLVLIAASKHVATCQYVPDDLESAIDVGLSFLQTWYGCSPSIEFCYKRLLECKQNRLNPPKAGRAAPIIHPPQEFFFTTESVASSSHFELTGTHGPSIRLPVPVIHGPMNLDANNWLPSSNHAYGPDVAGHNSPVNRQKRTRIDI